MWQDEVNEYFNTGVRRLNISFHGRRPLQISFTFLAQCNCGGIWEALDATPNQFKVPEK